MKILYDNLLKTATLTATNENSNYPIANVHHKWQKKYFLATTTSTVITAVLPTATTITAIALSYHNLSSCTARVYNADNELLDVWTIPVANQTEAYYDSALLVKKVTLTCASAGTLYIGEVFVGTALSLSKSADQNIPLESTDNATLSSDGQVSGRQGSLLRSATITLPVLLYTERQSMETAYQSCGLLTPFFLDLWDLSHASFPPVYGRFTSELSITHAKDGDTVTFSFQEVH